MVVAVSYINHSIESSASPTKVLKTNAGQLKTRVERDIPIQEHEVKADHSEKQ
uniref:Uncharacterized protein n=1 Tax=Rhizophagus irregularis (strain DAOM 181602 / DAOM 197198 / MUCL 43194) TaxID=747089 RepID=U9ULM5_RHIID